MYFAARYRAGNTTKSHPIVASRPTGSRNSTLRSKVKS